MTKVLAVKRRQNKTRNVARKGQDISENNRHIADL